MEVVSRGSRRHYGVYKPGRRAEGSGRLQQPRLSLSWQRCDSGQAVVWCNLFDVDLRHPHLENVEGVYIIWQNQGGSVIRVGQGNIRARLALHRADPRLRAYAAPGLLVSWAQLPMLCRDGVERYLAEHLQPIAVNIPGELA